MDILAAQSRELAHQQAQYVLLMNLELLESDDTTAGVWDYAAYATKINGLTYYIPNDEDDYIIVADAVTKVAVETNFFEMDDFLTVDSDYAYVLEDGFLLERGDVIW